MQIKSSSQVSCSHCGLPMESRESHPSETPTFCCAGCRMAYQILNKSGMSHFYTLKKNSNLIRPVLPVGNKFPQYDYLDQSEFIQRYCKDNTLTFYLEGVHCVACLWLLERLGTFVDGVKEARLNLGNSQLRLTRKENASFSKIAQTLHQLGYPPHPMKPNEKNQLHKKEHQLSLLRIGVAAACAMNIMLFSIGLYTGATGILADIFRWGAGFLTLPILLFSAKPFFQGARSALLTRQITIDIPVVLAVTLGSGMSYLNLALNSHHIYFDSVATFTFLLLSTRHFFKYTYKKLDQDKILQATFIPLSATLKNTNGKMETRSTSSLNINDILIIKESETLPADGVLLSKQAYIDTHIMTGESTPSLMKEGTPLFAGMTNTGSTIEIQVTATDKQTRIGKLIEDISYSKQPAIVSLSDKIAQWFLLFILCLGTCFLAIDILYFNSFTLGINRLLSFIIVACPCALSLATPLTYSLCIKKAAEQGICIKNPNTIEDLKPIDTLVFDKTGTLTTGQLNVIHWKTQRPTQQLNEIVYALESNSNHPIAKAIVRYLKNKGLKKEIQLSDYQEIHGKGVSGTYNQTLYEIKALDQTLHTPSELIITQVGVYQNHTCIAQIDLGDALFPNVYPTLTQLEEQGFRLILLSGDSEQAVNKIQGMLPFHKTYAKQTPSDKTSFIQAHQTSIMIGDGANDAQALKAASVSIAVQGSLEVSLSAADIYFSAAGIHHLIPLLSLAKRARSTVRINFALALFYNGLGILCVGLGLITPILAAIIMPLSSACVFLVSFVNLRKI